MAQCRGCHAEIDFVPLNSGKRMPVESREPEEYRLFGKKAWAEEAMKAMGLTGRVVKVVLIVDGEVLDGWQALRVESGRVSPLDGPMVLEGVESHFAHCPNAADFRRP